MKILILGGTVFLGRHLVEIATGRGHDVTLFNRGRSGPDLFADVERLRGDRTRDVSALAGRRWDVVIDTSGYTPATVRRAAEMLAYAVDHYTFVSSVSVYQELAGIDESAATRSLTADELAEAENVKIDKRASAPSYGAMYGPLKALCEEAAEDVMPGRVLSVRPGLIVGPYDYSGRFTYWVHRVARGGEVLAPGRPERQVVVIDVRDLAEWILDMAAERKTGVYNATGLAGASTMGQYLEDCRAVAGSTATFTWVDEELLVAEGVGAWMELPLWLPEEHNGFFEIRADKALADGLTLRPWTETIRDTLAWVRESGAQWEWQTGLAPERERELLRKSRPAR